MLIWFAIMGCWNPKQLGKIVPAQMRACVWNIKGECADILIIEHLLTCCGWLSEMGLRELRWKKNRIIVACRRAQELGGKGTHTTHIFSAMPIFSLIIHPKHSWAFLGFCTCAHSPHSSFSWYACVTLVWFCSIWAKKIHHFLSAFRTPSKLHSQNPQYAKILDQK